MALIGKIEEYDEKESWIEYTERLGQYFAVNEITDSAKKRAILLSVCGAKTYKLIRNLVSPRKPTDKSFAELVNLVKNHLNPRPSSIVYRCKCNSRFRQQGETIGSLRYRRFRGDGDVTTQVDWVRGCRMTAGLYDFVEPFVALHKLKFFFNRSMASFEEFCHLLIFYYDANLISDEEFLLLYEMFPWKNPNFPYDDTVPLTWT